MHSILENESKFIMMSRSMIEQLCTNNSSIARWIRRSRSRYVSEHSPIIVGGCQRSGTTLLRVMLDSHRHIACGPETSLLAGSFLPHKLTKRFSIPLDEIWRLRARASDHVHFVDLFLTRYAADRGRQRWAEKTPRDVRFLGYILAHFPKAKFIHMIRDGRDVVCSIRTHPKYRIIDGKKVATGIHKPIEPCIDRWLYETEQGLRWRGHPNYFEVRYEELVKSPETELRKLCDFVGEPWDPAMLEYHEQTGASRDASNFIANEAATQPLSIRAIERWRKDLNAEELALFYRHAGRRMVELGYEVPSIAAPIFTSPHVARG